MDRIFDAYNGIGGFGVEFMRKTRERMKWICEQVSGASVLDVGCSQGVCPILLGQAGFTVLGVDVNGEAVAFANEKLSGEDESVKKAVQFVQGNFSTCAFGDRHFDNVIFGEVLEHLLRPEIFIEKAYSVLNPGGRVVITVPFGINDDPDHKQTFYFARIKRILYPYFEITKVRYFGSWIGFVGVRRDEKVAFVPSGDFIDIENVEGAMFGQERQLRDRIIQLLDNSRKQNETQKLLKDQIGALNTRSSELVAKAERAEKARAAAEEKVRQQQDQAARLAADKQTLEGRVAGLDADKRTLEERVAGLDADKRTLEEQVARQAADSRKLHEKLAGQTARGNRAASDYAKMKTWYERKRDEYNKLSRAKLGRLTLWYWKLKDGLKARIKGAVKRKAVQHPWLLSVVEKLWVCKGAAKTAVCRTLANGGQGNVPRGVTVVIPTYTKVAWLADAVKSVLAQKSDMCSIQVVICVNGPDEAYYEDLKREYSGIADVEVLHTLRAGANAGRNIGVEAAKKEFIAFLDCDDMLTKGYFKSLLRHFADPDVNIVVGRLVNLDDKTGKRDAKNYVNSAMSKLGMGPVDYHAASPFLASFCMKVYRTAFMRDQLGKLDEGERHTEDVLFWARRFGRMTGKVYISDPFSSEAYVRRLTENSLSRPSKESSFQFYIVDRLKILDALQDVLLNGASSSDHKDFVLSRIKAQVSIMRKFFDGLDEASKQVARQKIRESRNLFLNKALFSDVEAIAFCHNFSPSVDASAFVATKRLRMIDQEEGQMLRWHVISQDMSKIRSQDNMFQKYYADFVCAEQIVLNESFGFAPAAQVAFAKAAFKVADRLPVPRVIYSRALFVGSHMAAYQYKKAHPEVKWYAEFSDPLAYGVDNKPRDVKGKPDWNEIEQMVYELADVIIFTNRKQRDYMLSYNPCPRLNKSIRRRSIVRMHPVIDPGYCKVVSCAYEMDDSKINIGFFGTFYVTRKCEDMLAILDNKDVVLHIFTTKPETMKEIADRYGSQVRINNTVTQFEFLNLGSRMDYLILTDTEFPGSVNPFLPSKYADYLVTGTPIIAKVAKGSTLSNEDNRALLRTPNISKELVQSLKKRKK